MADRKNVIEGLLHEIETGRGKCGHLCREGYETDDCIYDAKGMCIQHWGKDALTLLKAQEPIKPKVNIDTWVCGNCGTRIERQSLIGPNAVLAETFKFCPECGKAVKWDG